MTIQLKSDDGEIDDHGVKQGQPVVAVREATERSQPQKPVRARGVLPVGARDRRVARPVESSQFQRAESARDIEGPDDDEKPDEDRE